jgi:hypothetical protein
VLAPFMGLGELITAASLITFLISACRELFRRRVETDVEAANVDPVRLAAE